jgi:hypothetical protein
MVDVTDTEKGCYTDHGVSGYGVAVKLSRNEPMDDPYVKSMAEQMMLAIAEKCMARGARCIGHIKSHVMSEAGSIKADTLGTSHGAYSGGKLSHPVTQIFMAVNSIVQGIREQAVRAATLEGIHEVAEGNGIHVDKEKEHAYFDEFDFTASKQDLMRQLEKQFAVENEASRQAEDRP